MSEAEIVELDQKARVITTLTLQWALMGTQNCQR